MHANDVGPGCVRMHAGATATSHAVMHALVAPSAIVDSMLSSAWPASIISADVCVHLQVVAIVTAGAPSKAGLFFPNGLNGNIKG